MILLKIADKLSDFARWYESRNFRVSLDCFSYEKAIGYIAFFAFLLRLLIASSYISSFDTEWNIMWGVQLGDGFFSAYTHVDALDYPPLYLYPLYVVGRLINVRSIGLYPPFRMLAIKFVPCLTDSLTCLVLYRLAARRDNKPLGLFAGVLWLVNPASIVNCACWGQTDCVLMFMAALLMLALEEKHVMAAGVLWAAMCSTKLQGLYLTPVVGMEVLTICFGRLHPKEFSLSRLTKPAVLRFVRFVCASALTLALVYLPFMLGGVLSSNQPELGFFEKYFKPITVYSEGLDKYPYITLNADNIYMLFGMNAVNDELQVLTGVSVALLGKLFLLLAMALVVAVYLFGKRKSHWLAGFMFMECVFMLTCRQHERYQILTLVLLLGAFVTLADRRMLKLFCLNSLVIFFNQFRVLSGAREDSGWWRYYRYGSGWAEWLNKRNDFAFVNSLCNTALFIAAMIFVIRFFTDEESDRPVISRAYAAFKRHRDSVRS